MWRRERAAALAALIVGTLGAGAAHAEGPALRRFTRPPAPPSPRPTPTPTPSPSRKPDHVSQLSGPDDRVTAHQAPVVGAALPGVPVDVAAFARFGACTATHIGRGIFLTAGHCVEPQLGLRGLRSGPCPHTLATDWGVEPQRCSVVVFRYDASADYAVLALDDPAVARGRGAVGVDYAIDWAVAKKRAVRLYGYSGGVLRANLWCEARYDAARARLTHQCDTEGGDSGSALIDLMTGRVIGIHAGALTGGGNYGYAIGSVPWSDALCVELRSTARLPLVRGGAHAVLYVSTRQLAEPFGYLRLELKGRSTRANTRVRVLGPGVELTLDPAWMTWSGTTWRYQDVFTLDVAEAGPWSVDAEFTREPAGALERGYIDGRILVCP